jgi:hypothetical protein
MSAAAIVALLALVAFGASLIVEWQIATTSVAALTQNAQQLDQQATAPVGVPVKLVLTFSEWAYIAGGIALLGVTGWAIMNSESAARLRGLVLGSGGGLLALVIAMIVRARDTTAALLVGNGLAGSQTTMSIRPGALFAVAAAVLPIVAVFLVPARVTAPAVAPPPPAPVPRPVAEVDVVEVIEEPPAVWMPTSHYEGVSGLTVMPSDPREGEQWRR